ncbi:MAG: PIN domain-containing protein [Pirellulales bacterium]|nr:PIN domain-containing protein [Pirellulales bacterium]
MRAYLDVSCLNRPFDNQSQARIRIEASAIVVVFEQFDLGEWEHVSSAMARIEIRAIPDDERRNRVQLLMPGDDAIIGLNQQIFDRAAKLQELGFHAADAVHVAAAESADADVFLSCDDRLCRAGKRHGDELQVDIYNPVDFVKDLCDANS